MKIFLDVETDWSGRLTVVGFKAWGSGLVQLVGSEISRSRLLRLLPSSGEIVTFNGHCFDLPRIRTHLGVDLRERFDSLDLRWLCWEHGMTGGQKAVEKRIGFRRDLDGYDGMDAVRLWDRHKRGDSAALHTLLDYNAEDLDGLKAIQRFMKAGTR